MNRYRPRKEQAAAKKGGGEDLSHVGQRLEGDESLTNIFEIDKRVPIHKREVILKASRKHARS